MDVLMSKMVEFVFVVGVIWLTALLVWPNRAGAHCDTLDGPVVTEARLALMKGDVTPVLKWVDKESEEEVRTIFDKALAVRTKGAEVRELADLYFFENLVRLHRASEGEPYTGLKPAGHVESPIMAADKAIADGNVNNLAKETAQAVEKSIQMHFEKLMNTKETKDNSIEAGRKYVKAYVTFVHYVEELHNIVSGGVGHHH